MYSATRSKSPGHLPASNTAIERSAKVRRLADVTNKAWGYCLDALREPSRLPFIAYSCAARKAHLGELLVLDKHRDWMRKCGIKTVLDVGANSGQFASAVRCVLPDAQIYSFEPIPEIHDKLLKRLQPFGRFKSFCVALGNQTREANFWRCEFSKSSSLLPMSQAHQDAFPWTSRNTVTKVQLDKLDNHLGLIELNPGVLLKLDVQGYELGVLEGAREILRRVQYVQVETSFAPLYEGQSSFADVYRLLTQAEFDYAGSLGQMFSPVDGNILQEDALFRRRIG
jgi:FkbM family methyltransferase